MRPKTITLENFKTFHGQHVFDFPEKQDGFFHLAGRNLLEPDLGANGVGKSTLWDALCWVLFGKSARGLKGKHLASWGEHEWYRVRLDFEKDGEEHSLYRSYAPSTIQLNDKEVSQEGLEDFLGLNHALFLSTVLLGQFNKFFFDISPQEKLNLFTTVLGLDFWSQASEIASKKLSSFKDQVVEMEGNLRELDGKLSELREARSRIKTQFLVYNEQRETRLQELRRLLKGVEEQKVHRDKVVKFYAAKLQAAKAAKEESEGVVYEAEARITKQKEEIRDQKIKLQALETEGETLKKRTEGLVRLSGQDASCPYCQQAIPTAHANSILTKWNADLHGIFNKRDLQRLKVKEEAEKLSKLELEKAKQVRLLSGVIEGLEKRGAEFDKVSRLLNETNQKRAGLLEKIQDLKGNQNPYGEELTRVRASISTQSAKHEALKLEIHKKEVEVRSLGFWPQGFKELRLWLTEVALQEFELEVNSSLVELGLAEWRVKFSLERETQAGTISRGFRVEIMSPLSPEGVPWESWSGGETQRLRIAGAIGLSNLIRARCGLTLPFEIWDEPTAHLSVEGIDDLLEFFYNRARRESKQVWLVEHKALSSGKFDQTFVVVKRKQGSRISSRL